MNAVMSNHQNRSYQSDFQRFTTIIMYSYILRYNGIQLMNIPLVVVAIVVLRTYLCAYHILYDYIIYITVVYLD